MKNIQDIVFDFNAMCDFELTTGTTLISFFSKDDEISMTNVRALVKAGLGVTEVEAGNVISEYLKENDIGALFKLIGEKLHESGLMKSKKKK